MSIKSMKFWVNVCDIKWKTTYSILWWWHDCKPWETSRTFSKKESQSSWHNIHHNVVGGQMTGSIFFFLPLCAQLSFISKYHFPKTGLWTLVCCSATSAFSSAPASPGACRDLKEAGSKGTEQCGTWVPRDRHFHFAVTPNYLCSFDQIT